MRKLWTRVALVAVVACLVVSTNAQGQYARETAISEAVEKTQDAIVSIKVTRDRGYGMSDIDGSGVVVDEAGYAITNYHVIKSASRIQVTFADQTRVSASIYASVPSRDLAILKLATKKRVKALKFAPGTDLKIGETVIAVGNPYGFDHTVTTGIISARRREISVRSDEKLANVIQHSAPINPGNSGGPLLNINGEMIGINLALREGAQNISFALNAETVKEVLTKYLSASRLAGVSHGLTCEDKAVKKVGTGRQRVVVVTPIGPAARAGLTAGDMILKVGGVAVENRFDLERALWAKKAGDSVSLAVLRDGKESMVSLQLASSQGTQVTSTSSPRTRDR
jgi:serine protease Do